MAVVMKEVKCAMDSKAVGSRIKTARNEKDYTQAEVAAMCACTSTHISNVENGKGSLSLDLLLKLCVVLEKNMDYFIMDNRDANPEIKINLEIAPKLAQCDPQMLEMVDCFLDRLIAYRDSMQKQMKKDSDT